MIDKEKFDKLRAIAEKARTERDKAEGLLEAAKQRLKEEFGCKDLKAAKKLAAELDAEATDAEEAYETALAAFEEEWGDELDNLA